ncbi:MAG: hypothetical protein LIO44_07400 [Eubacterium sp.]|nr:hypothetical protein [Eubacterium sp.]
MNNSLTELIFILDRSGSMSFLTDDTIGGFNSMIEKQRQESGDAVVTTVLFDNEYQILHDHLPISEIEPLTRKEYFARGSTALLDAVGMTVNTVKSRLSSMSEAYRPGKVIFVITTDGMENSSREYNRAQVKQMITNCQEKDGWNFIFLGANIDAVKEAASIGIDRDFARNYTASSVGTKTMYEGVSATMSSMRVPSFNRNVRNESYKAAMKNLDSVEKETEEDSSKNKKGFLKRFIGK